MFKAQSTVEYLILFCIISCLTLVSISAALNGVRRALGEDSSGAIVGGGFLDDAVQGLR